MSKYDHRRPRYVREWYLKLKNRFKKREALKSLAMAANEIDDGPSPSKSAAPRETVAVKKEQPK
jgi:hypothetical protein